MISIDFPNIDWLLMRQALSLALLSEKAISIRNADPFFENNRAYKPLYEDIVRIVHETGAGKITTDNESLTYEPAKIAANKISFVSGPFSSAMEVLLFLMPALFFKGFRTVLDLGGVTHSSLSPPTAFVKETLLTLLERMGFYGSLALNRFGFYGSGGGAAESRIYPHEPRKDSVFSMPAFSSVTGAKIFISGLNKDLALREKAVLSEQINLGEEKIAIIDVLDSDGIGNSVQISIDCANTTLVLYRDMRIYQEKGEVIFTEEDLEKTLLDLAAETRDVLERGKIPIRLIREIYPYIVLSGSAWGGSSDDLGFESTKSMCGKMLK